MDTFVRQVATADPEGVRIRQSSRWYQLLKFLN